MSRTGKYTRTARIRRSSINPKYIKGVELLDTWVALYYKTWNIIIIEKFNDDDEATDRYLELDTLLNFK